MGRHLAPDPRRLSDVHALGDDWVGPPQLPQQAGDLVGRGVGPERPRGKVEPVSGLVEGGHLVVRSAVLLPELATLVDGILLPEEVAPRGGVEEVVGAACAFAKARRRARKGESECAKHAIDTGPRVGDPPEFVAPCAWTCSSSVRNTSAGVDDGRHSRSTRSAMDRFMAPTSSAAAKPGRRAKPCRSKKRHRAVGTSPSGARVRPPWTQE